MDTSFFRPAMQIYGYLYNPVIVRAGERSDPASG